jgi:uncharacterized protein (TIGR03435 family)
MTRHGPPRLAIALLDRFLPCDQALTGDLLEAARFHSRAWFWRQTVAAVVWSAITRLDADKRTAAESVVRGTALLAVLGFHAVVAASLVNHVLVLNNASWMSATGEYQRWQAYSTVPSFATALLIGRVVGRFHREHRIAAILAFSVSVTVAAFINLYLFVPNLTVQPFVTDVVPQTVVAMVFIAGLLIGIVSAPVARGIAICGVVVLAGLGGGADAQVASQRFDVASIRRNVTGAQQGSGLSAPQPGGRYVAIGVTLRRLAGDAYDLDVLGGPVWADSERFDVNAKAEGEPTPAQVRAMLRPLLADRFKLAVHTEAREMPVYTLAVARTDRKPGEKLRQSDPKCAAEAQKYFPGTPGFPPPCGDFRMGGNTLLARAMTMDGLAHLLSGSVGRPVLNRTGLDGAFDIELEWSSDVGLLRARPDSAGAGDLRPDGVTLFTALQEQLGLRLEAARAPVDVLVIDSAEPPTPD